jgi:hypothetical protein
MPGVAFQTNKSRLTLPPIGDIRRNPPRIIVASLLFVISLFKFGRPLPRPIRIKPAKLDLAF